MSSTFIRAAFIALALYSMEPAPSSSQMPAEHPGLFATREELARAPQRVDRHPWAHAAYQKILSRAHEAIANPLDIPDKGGQWTHFYVCPQHGAKLKNVSPTEHRCPEEGEILSGWPYDDAYISYIHHRLTGDLTNLGLAYQFTGDRRFAARAREILLGYADRYPSYPLHDRHRKVSRHAGRRFAQTLDEAVDLIKLAWAYDLVYEFLSPEERDHIENNLLRATVATIVRNDAGVSNWQAWHNAGMAAVGFCLGDQAMVDMALDGKSGFHFQMENSILPDGWWYEGTPGYHFYSVDALVWTAEAAIRKGVDLYADGRLRSLFDGPLRLAEGPDLMLPTVNDGSPFSLFDAAHLYESAYSRYQAAEFLPLLAGYDRKNERALLWGPEDSSSSPASYEPTCHLSEGIGLAVLRNEPGPGIPPISLYLDYGPHGGGHGHPDKLNVIFYAWGRELAVDPGSPLYSVPAYQTWYKQTASHNTLVVDGQSQQPTTGKLLLFSPDGPLKAVAAASDGAYEGVVMTRGLVLKGNLWFDILTAESQTSHKYDLFWHQRGDLELSPSVIGDSVIPAEGDGYQHLSGIRTGAIQGQLVARWQYRDGLQVQRIAPAETSDRVFTGVAPGQPMTEGVSFILHRKTGRRVVFVSVFEVTEGAVALEHASVHEAEEYRGLEVELGIGGNAERLSVRLPGSDVVVRGNSMAITYETAAGETLQVPQD